MVEGESRVQASKAPLLVRIPAKVAEALGISAGEEVDVDYFDEPEEFNNTYGERAFIAITRK